MNEARLSAIRAEIERRGLKSTAIETPEEHSLLERVGQFGRGMATGTAGMLDLAANYLPSGQKMAHAAVEDYGYQEPDYGTSNLSGQVGEFVDRAAGQSLEPTEEDKIGQFLHGAGEFAAPFPGSGYVKAAKLAGKSIPALAKGISKVAGKEVARGVGASAATMTPQISEEGSLMSIPENIGKAIIGARAGEKLLSPGAAKAILTAPKKAFTELPAKVMSLATEPNKEVFELAKKHGVELPLNVGIGGKGGSIQSWIHNNFLKSIFVSKQYKDAINKSDQSIIDAVKRNIDTLGPSELKPSEVSGDYQRLIKGKEKQAEGIADKLYERAEKFLKTRFSKGPDSDKVVPKNTLKSIESLRELFSRDIKSPATKKVVKILGDLSESWGINSQDLGYKNMKSFKEALEHDPKLGKIILDNMGKLGAKGMPIDIERLIGVRKELGTITGYDPDIKGVEAYLNKLRGDITKDIESSSNKQFVDAWQKANKFFKQTVVDRFRTDLARSMTTGEMPKEAYSLMTNAKQIKELEKIAGTSAKSKEIFNSLKKAKVQDIFANALSGKEKLSMGNFINLFKKGTQQETLGALLPPESYKNMTELTDIAREYQKSGRDLLNTSGTSWVTADINRLNDLKKAAIQSIFGTVGIGSAAATAGATPVVSAVVAAATPNLLSRMVSNPKIVAKARAYALARQQGKEQYADTLMSQLMKMSESDAKAALVAAQQSTKKEKE